MLKALDATATQENKDRTQVIREAIAQYLDLSLDSVEVRLARLEVKIEQLESQLCRKNDNEVN